MVPRPIRVKRQRVVKEGELEKAVELAASRAGAGGTILILLDADEDCPKDLAPRLLARVSTRADRPVRLVLAKQEYEAWLVAAATSIAGHRGLADNLVPPADPEGIGSPKAWLRRNRAGGYKYRETVDQAALTRIFDLEAARVAPSFDKLCRDLAELLV